MGAKVASRVTLLQLRLYFALSGLIATTSAISKDRGLNASTDWLGLITGDQAGAEIVLGTEMAELFAADAPAELQGEGRHPKWREINLAAGLPGWTRTPEAETGFAQHSDEKAEPVKAKPNIEAGAALPLASPVGHDRREALFKQFIEWQRAKGH